MLIYEGSSEQTVPLNPGARDKVGMSVKGLAATWQIVTVTKCSKALKQSEEHHILTLPRPDEGALAAFHLAKFSTERQKHLNLAPASTRSAGS